MNDPLVNLIGFLVLMIVIVTFITALYLSKLKVQENKLAEERSDLRSTIFATKFNEVRKASKDAFLHGFKQGIKDSIE